MSARILVQWLLFGLLVCTGTSALEAQPPDHGAIQRRWVLALHEWAVPRYAGLRNSATKLSTALDSFCAQSPTPAALARVQSRWLDTMLRWRELEALQLGPTLARRSSKSIDFWPTRPSVIEQAVAATGDLPLAGTQTEEAMQLWGTAAKGLPALEWLLYADGNQTAPILRSAAHCLFARRLAVGVNSEISVLHAGWQEESTRWTTASASDLQGATHDVLNLLVGSCELIRGKKMLKGAQIVALRGRQSTPSNAFDSTRSGMSRRFLLAHFDGLAQMLVGRSLSGSRSEKGPAVSMMNVLEQEGQGAMARELDKLATRAGEALRALPADPAQWTVERLTPAADALRELRTILDPRISGVLNVTVTFTDADGD